MKKYGVSQRNKMGKENKGITLMSLVVTVIVLLILATVTIAEISGHGIIESTRKAKDQAEMNGELKVIGVASNAAKNLDKYGDLEEENFDNSLKTNAGKGKYRLKYYKENNMFSVTFISSGRVYLVYANGDVKYLGILEDAIIIDADPRGSISLNNQYRVNITVDGLVHDNIDEIKYVWTDSVEEPSKYNDEGIRLKNNGTENSKITETPIELKGKPEGNYYLHVQVTKDNGETVTETFGPYAIGTAAVKLAVDPNGGTWNGKRGMSEVKGKPENTIKIDDPVPQSNYIVKFKDGENQVQSIDSDINFEKWNLEGAGDLTDNNYTFKDGRGSLVAQYRVDSITLPTIEKEGNSIEGWYKGDTKVGNPGDEYILTYSKDGEETLTVKWKLNKYEVTFDYKTNGGTSCTKDKVQVEYGSKVNLLGAIATKEGYTFIGWNTNKDATSAQTGDIKMTTDGVTVYAIFKDFVKITV